MAEKSVDILKSENILSIEDDTGLAIQTSIMSICTSFAKYFAGENVNPKKGCLEAFYPSSTTMLVISVMPKAVPGFL